MTIPTICRFCKKMAPYPNVIESVKLEDKIYAFKLKCNDCEAEYWTIWNKNLDSMPPIYVDYELMKKRHEDSVKRLEELNLKAEAEVDKLRPKILALREKYKGPIKLKRQLKKIIQSNT